MKKNTRKLLSLLLIAAMALGMLAGCGGNQPETTAPQETDPATTPATNPVETTEPPVSTRNADIYPLDCDTTFTIVTAREDINEMANVALWNEVTGVDIEWITQLPDQVQLTLAGGDMPDAFFNLNASYITKATIYEYGSAGKFINFMDYLEYMPNFAKAIAENPSYLTSVMNADGTVYTLPRVGNSLSQRGRIHIRTDMLNGAGWDHLPTTTDEFLQCIMDIQAVYGKDDPEFTAFQIHSKGTMEWSSAQVQWFFFPAFGELLETNLTVDSSGNVVLGAATEQYKHYLEFMNDVYNSGAMNKDVYTEDGTVSKAKVQGSKVAVATHTMNALKADVFASGEKEVALVPILTSEYYSEKHWMPFADSNFTSTVVTSECEDLENMLRWLDSYYAPMDNPLNEEGTVWGISMSYGELGVDFELDVEEGYFKILDHEGYDSTDAWTQANSFGLSLGMYDWLYYDTKAGNYESEALINEFFPYADKNHVYLANIPLTEDEMLDYGDYWTDINNYVGEMTAKFITGELDIETEWDNYVKELYNLNLQDVLDIYQTAYDRYISLQN